MREFCELAFREVGIELEWQGSGVDEKGIVKKVYSEKFEEIVNRLLKDNSVQSSEVKGQRSEISGQNSEFKSTQNTTKINSTVPNTTKLNSVNLDAVKLNASKLNAANLVEISPIYYRPTEVDLLIGNPKKAKEKLGWEARTKFEDLVKLMVEADIKKVIEKGY